jgi:archaellum component FlaF (FlaF/FlaG flagellin family)
MNRYILAALFSAIGTAAYADGRQLTNQVPNTQAAITPSDATLIQCNAIYVGSVAGGSDMSLVLTEGGTVTWSNVQAGTQYWVQVRQVRATGTTASSLICLR